MPNFEARADNVYNVTVVVTDSDNNIDSRTVAVTVTNVEEAWNGNPVQPAAGGWSPDKGYVDRPRRRHNRPQVAVGIRDRSMPCTDITDATSDTYTPTTSNVAPPAKPCARRRAIPTGKVKTRRSKMVYPPIR